MDHTGSALEQRIEALIAPALADMGYEVVRIMLVGGREHQRVQVMAERADRSGMTVDDCADISRAVSALMDVEDPIAGAYVLEVSSPGIDRPLTREADFERFAGHEAKFELVQAIDGRRRLRGRIAGLEKGVVAVECEGGSVMVPFREIRKAKLVITDALIQATGPNQQEKAAARH